jgi:hypothetical protein
MDNFTPLKINNKPKANKFLVFANVLLVVLSIGLPIFFLNNQNRKIIINEKAAEISEPTKIPAATIMPTSVPTIIPTEEPTIIPTTITPTEASTSAPIITPSLTITPQPQ